MPVYITTVGALLFLAFAYFAVGQAAANRGDAQGAADAAALAAAHEARVLIGTDLVDAMRNEGDLDDLLAALRFSTGPPCDQARLFAAKNGATSESCVRTVLPRSGFEVAVTSQESLGSSVVPGVEDKRSNAAASAVIEPLCTLREVQDDEVVLKCRGGDLTIDPESPDPLPDLDDLFRVRLVD